MRSIEKFGELLLKVQISISLIIFIFALPLQIDRIIILSSLSEDKIVVDSISTIYLNKEVKQKQTLIKPHLTLFKIQSFLLYFNYINNLHSINLTIDIFHPPKFS